MVQFVVPPILQRWSAFVNMSLWMCSAGVSAPYVYICVIYVCRCACILVCL